MLNYSERAPELVRLLKKIEHNFSLSIIGAINAAMRATLIRVLRREYYADEAGIYRCMLHPGKYLRY